MNIRNLMLNASVSALVLATTGFVGSVHAADAPPSDSNDQGIIVTARRQALQDAIEVKKNATTIVDSVVADDAGRLPDNSITEVLARVSGVTMSRFNGSGDAFQVEGTGVQIRGLSNPSSMLNGREIFSANGGSGLSWGEVTPELMAAVDIYKATTADLIEGGTGGAINLRTKMPFDYKKATIEGTVGISYGDMSKKYSPTISVLATDRFDTNLGEMGILVDVAYSKLNTKSSYLNIEPYFKRLYQGQDRYIPGGFGWGDNSFQRERTGVYEAFQWKPTDNLTLFQTYFSSHYKSQNSGTGVWVADARLMPTSGEATFDKNGVLVSAEHMSMGSYNDGTAGSTVGQSWLPEADQVDCNAPFGAQAQTLNWGASPPTCSPVTATAASSRNFSTTDNLTKDFSQGFSWEGDSLRVRGALQHVKSRARNTGMSVGLSTPITGYSADFSGKLPVLLIDNSASLDSPASYRWGQLSWRPVDNKGSMTAGNLDFDYKVGDGFLRTVSGGVRMARRSETDTYVGTYWASLGADWNGSPVKYLSDGPAEDSELYEFANFFHGNVAVPHTFYVPSAKLINSRDYEYVMNTYGYDKTMRRSDGQLVQSPYDVLHVNPGYSHTNVDTDAAYIQATFGSDKGLFGVPFTGNIGLRAVRTKTTAIGDFIFSQTNFYASQADANADFQDDPTGKTTSRAITVLSDTERRQDQSKDTRFLPAFNINFKPTDKFFIRLAANKTLSRPSYGDITVAGNGSVNTIANTNNFTEVVDGQEVQRNFLPIFNGIRANVGNTTLKPTIATSFDASFEWYRSWSTSAHLALFHKTLKDLIIFGDTIVPLPYSFTKQDGTLVEGVASLTTTQASNATENATINGFEIGGRTFFDKLPGFWSGFGVSANFTYINSKNPAPKAYDMDGNRFTNLPVTGMSKYAYNIQLMYSKSKLYVGLAYNWRSRFLMSTNANGTGGNDTTYTYCSDTSGTCGPIHYSLPLYGHAYGQLDFGANYQVNKHLRVYVQANNLTNQTARSDVEILPGKFYGRAFNEADRRIDFGFNFKF